MVSCTGCSIVVDGVALPGTGGGSSTPFLTRTIVGNGVGAFSGVTNFNLGTVEYYYANNRAGTCTGFSGQLTAVSPNQSGTGLFSWSSSTYVCTGTTSCTVSVYQKFIPHPALSGIAPNFYAHIQVYNSEGNFDIGRVRAGGSYTTPTYTYNAGCGFQDYLFNSVRFGLAPYSGYIGTETATTINCLPCTVGL